MEIKKSAVPPKCEFTNRAKRIIEILNAAGYKNRTFSLVLDAGCGYGDISLSLARYYNLEVIGIDLYEEGLEKARATAKELGLSCNFYKASVEELSCFKNNTFDLVISCNVLEHVNNQEKMIEELHRVLRSGGVLFLTVPNKYWIFESHYKLPFLSWTPKKMSDFYVRLFRKNDYYDVYPVTWAQLNSLLAKYFKTIDMTPFVLKNVSRLYDGPEYHSKIKYYIAKFLSLMPINVLEVFSRMFTEAFFVVGVKKHGSIKCDEQSNYVR